MTGCHKGSYRKLKPTARCLNQLRLDVALGALDGPEVLEILWRERWRVPVGGRGRQVWTGVDRANRVVTIEHDPTLTGLASPWPRPKDLEHGHGEGGQG